MGFRWRLPLSLLMSRFRAGSISARTLARFWPRPFLRRRHPTSWFRFSLSSQIVCVLELAFSSGSAQFLRRGSIQWEAPSLHVALELLLDVSSWDKLPLDILVRFQYILHLAGVRSAQPLRIACRGQSFGACTTSSYRVALYGQFG